MYRARQTKTTYTMKKLLISSLLISLLLLSSCNKKDKSEDYSSEDFTFKYPSTYSIIEKNDATIIVKNKHGRIEIFKTDYSEDFPIHGYSSSGLEEFEKELVPKTELSKENYTMWLFHEKKDITTKTELEEVYNSFQIYKESDTNCLENYMIYEDTPLSYPGNFKNLNTTDATNLVDEKIIGYYLDLNFEDQNEKEIIRELLNSKYISTFWHLDSSLCLTKETTNNNEYIGYFDAEHEYCTNKCITDEYSFHIQINKETGAILIKE